MLLCAAGRGYGDLSTIALAEQSDRECRVNTTSLAQGSDVVMRLEDRMLVVDGSRRRRLADVFYLVVDSKQCRYRVVSRSFQQVIGIDDSDEKALTTRITQRSTLSARYNTNEA